MSARRTPKEDLLIGGLDDWADAGWVLQSSRLSGETRPRALREIALALIAEVLREGLMTAGDMVNGKHVIWSGDPEKWIERIRNQWLEEWGEKSPSPGAIVWLDNTSAGDAFAAGVLAREGNS